MRKMVYAITLITVIAAVCIASAHYGFWEDITIVRFSGQINPVKIDTNDNMLDLEIGALNPGQTFDISEPGKIDLSHNIYNADARIVLRDCPCDAFSEFMISGAVMTDNSIVEIFTDEEMIYYYGCPNAGIVINNIPLNATIYFDEIKGKASLYASDTLFLDNMKIAVYLYPGDSYDGGLGAVTMDSIITNETVTNETVANDNGE